MIIINGMSYYVVVMREIQESLLLGDGTRHYGQIRICIGCTEVGCMRGCFDKNQSIVNLFSSREVFEKP